MTAIRNHKQDALIEAIAIMDIEDDPVLQNMYLMAPGCSEDRQALRDACQAVSDPAALAEILSENLRGFGVDAVFRLISDYGTHGRRKHTVVVWDKAETTPDAILLDYDGHFVWRIIRMPQARALLLRLLQLPEGATSTDALREVEAT